MSSNPNLQSHDQKLQPLDYDDKNNNNKVILKCEIILAANHEILISELPAGIIKKGGDDQDPKTPTSTNQRIPVIGPCPPAPKKPKSRPMICKRKYSSHINNDDHTTILRTSNSASRLLDFSIEVESMFPPIFRANFGRKIKKARSL